MILFRKFIFIVALLASHAASVEALATQLCPDCLGMSPGIQCLAITADGKKAYVGFSQDDALIIVDLSTFNATKSIDVSAAGTILGSFAAKLTPNGDKLWISNWGVENFVIVDTSTNEVERILDIAPGGGQVHFNADGSKAYLLGRYDSNLYIINTSDYSLNTISLINQGIQFEALSSSLIQPNLIYGIAWQHMPEGADRFFYRLNTQTETITKSPNLSEDAIPDNVVITDLLINPAETEAYIGTLRLFESRGYGNIVAFDLVTFELDSWSTIENGVQDMDLNTQTGKIYSVGMWGGGLHPDSLPITEWDTISKAVTGTIMVSPASDQRAILIDPSDKDYLYMTEGDYNILRKVHIPIGQEVDMVKFNTSNLTPMNIITGGGIGYVTCLNSMTVFKLDLSSGSIVGYFTLPWGYNGMTQGGYYQGYLYFPWGDAMLKIDPSDGSLDELYQLSQNVWAGEMTFWENKAVMVERVVGGSDKSRLVFFDAQTMQIIKTIDFPPLETGDEAFVSPDGNKLYISYGTTGGGSANVAIIDCESLEVIETIFIEGVDIHSRGVSNTADGYFDTANKRFYLTGWGSIYVIDMENDQLIDILDTKDLGDVLGRTIEVTGLSGVSPNQAGDKLFVSSLDANKMIFYDLANENWLPEITFLKGYFTTDETSSPNNELIYTINRESDNISVVDTATRQIKKIITLVEPGDSNRDDIVNLADAIQILRMLAGTEAPFGIQKAADANLDGMLGLEEVVYILEKVAGLRR